MVRRGPRNRPGLCIGLRLWNLRDQATSTYTVVRRAIFLLVAMVAVRMKESGAVGHHGIDIHHPDSVIVS